MRLFNRPGESGQACRAAVLLATAAIAVILLIPASAHGTLEASIDTLGTGFVSANVPGFRVMTIHLNNGTGDNYTNAVTSITFTFRNVSGFWISQIADLGIFNESGDSPGYDAMDVRLDTVTPPAVTPAPSWPTYEVFLDAGAYLPSSYLPNATYYVVIVDTSALLEDAQFDITIQNGGISSTYGTAPISVVSSGTFTVDNTPPSAAFTMNTPPYISQGDTVVYTSAASDVNGISAYEWDLDGDGTYETTGVSPSFQYVTPGVYDVKHRVTDYAGNTNTTNITLTVNDTEAPVAAFQIYPGASFDEDTTVVFNGTPSTDNVGVVAWEWDFDGDSVIDSTGGNVSHVFPDPGTYDVSLTVYDSAGNNDTATIPVTVGDVTPPTPSFTVSPGATVDEDTSVTFNATLSDDNVGIVAYAWDFGDGTTDSSSGAAVSHIYPDPGSYTITLNVSDAAGNWDTLQTVVTVRDVTAPVCDFTATPSFTVDHGTPVTLSSVSTDNVGIVAYSWDVDGDGVRDATAPNVVINYSLPGQYAVNLTVRDAAGNTHWAEHTVTVVDVTDPVARISTSWGNVTDEDLQRQFFSSTSTDDWGIANRSWDLDGDGVVDSYDINPLWTYSEPGAYVVELTVTDLQGNTDTDTFRVTVLDITPPTVVLESVEMEDGTPFNGFMAGELLVRITADDNVGIRGVSLYRGYVHPSRLLGSDNIAPFEIPFNASSLPQGSSDLVVQAEDINGNVETSVPRTVSIDTLPPGISWSLGGPYHTSGDVHYFTDGASLVLTGTDTLSGLFLLEVVSNVDGVLQSESPNGTGSVSLPSAPLNTVEGSITLRAVDMLGNVNVTTIPVSTTVLGGEQFYPDTEGPSVTLFTFRRNAPLEEVNPSSLPQSGLSVTVLSRFNATGTDNGSGLARILVEVGYPNPSAFYVAPGAAFRVHLGAEYIRCTGEDELGNLGDEVYVPLSITYYGGIEVETSMMIFGWTEPSGGGYITWTLSGEVALDLRNQIIERYDEDLPGMPGYRIIDENEANDYLTEIEQSTVVRSLENPDLNNRDHRLLYWGAETNKYDPKYGGYDTNNDLTQSVQGMVDYGIDEEGPMSVEFTFSAEYLAGRQFPSLAEDFIVQVLFFPFRTGYVYDGPVVYSHQEVMVGLPAFYNPSVTDGSVFVLRTPIGEVAWYDVEYSGNVTEDKMETQDFSAVESPFILFLVVMVGAYLTNYLPGRFYSDMRDKLPRRMRIRARRAKPIHIISAFLILLLVALYIVPTPFVLFGSNFFFSGYIIVILSVVFPLIMGLTAFFVYKNKREDILGVRKEREEEPDAAVQTPLSDYPAATTSRTVTPSSPSNGVSPPPPLLPEKQPLPNCDICLGVIDKGMASLKCTCGANFHYSCIRRVGDCPVCTATIFAKDEAPAPPPKKETPPSPSPAVQEPEPEPESEPEETLVKGQCSICSTTLEYPEGADLLKVRCPKCGTILKNIERGFNHIVLSETPSPAFEMFVSLTRQKVPGMVISSTFPTKITRQFKLEEDTVVYWLTYTASSHNTLDPKRLEFECTRAISNFVKNNKGPVILLDGVEYLVIENSFEKILKFIKKVNDIASVNEATFIVAVNASSLPMDQLTTLKKEFDKVIVVEDYTEPPFD